MAITTTSQLIVKVPQYVEETTEGTTPTSSPTFAACGAAASLSLKKDQQYVDVAQLGPEDLLSLVKGPDMREFQIKFTLSDSTFLKYGVNAANFATPTGTISKSLSIVFSFYLNGTENFVFLKGSRCKSVSIAVEVGKPHEVTMDFVCLAISTAASSSGLTTPTHASTPSTAVWDWASGGADPVSWNSSAVNCKKFNITIDRNTKVDFTLGNSTGHSSQPHGRRISGDFMSLLTATTLESDYESGTARTLAVVLKSATSTLTVSNAKLTTYSQDREADSDEAVVEACGFRALSCTVS